MKLSRIVLLGCLLPALSAWAVYAPIPEQEQGKDWTITARGGIAHDSNIFGSPTGEISSMVYEFAPKIAFNSSLTAQTFVSASYALTLDHYDNRPGEKTLDSHDFTAHLDHAFSSVTSFHVSDGYSIVRNPESLLSGITLNTDQSFKRNVLDANFVTNLAPKIGVSGTFQSVDYAYDDANLATELDHSEELYSVAFNYALLPEVKTVGEYRHQDILYRTGGSTKDKHTDFLIGGADYAVAEQLTASGRLGYQWRQRDGSSDTQAPYVELDLKYNYAPQSFVTVGYVYTFEENSNLIQYNDTRVNRFMFSVQHALSALVIASGSIDYEPSELQGRGPQPNVAETTTRLGFALTYLPVKNWQITASYDYDNIDSDDPSRGQNRTRTGLSATFTY